MVLFFTKNDEQPFRIDFHTLQSHAFLIIDPIRGRIHL